MIPSRYRGIENTQKEVNEVLDKIRAEISELTYSYKDKDEWHFNMAQGMAITLKIIDKYREEQE